MGRGGQVAVPPCPPPSGYATGLQFSSKLPAQPIAAVFLLTYTDDSCTSAPSYTPHPDSTYSPTHRFMMNVGVLTTLTSLSPDKALLEIDASLADLLGQATRDQLIDGYL